MNSFLIGLLLELLIFFKPSVSRALDESSVPMDSSSVMFKEEPKLIPPEPCASGINFCGEDESKYPAKELIELFVKSNIKVQQWIDETAFQKDELPFKEDTHSESEAQSIIPACQSRREKFPSFGRSRNIKNKWKYIVEISQITNQSSNAEILICERPGEKCLNDSDSPDGEGSTVCRQAYRNQRLLALDENGQTSVDSFPLPSGCICHHLQTDANLRKASIFGSPKMNVSEDLPAINLRIPFIPKPEKKCEYEDDSQIYLNHGRIRRSNDRIVFPDDPESTNVVPMPNSTEDDLAPRAHESFKDPPIISEVEPCPNGDDFCELLPSYPKNFIDAAVNKSNDFKGLHPVEFNLYHSTICQDEVFNGIHQRIGTYESGEVPLCVSVTEIIHPQKGRNVLGLWRHIVNTDVYRQGVSTEKCVKNFEGKSCLYDGAEGIFPEATVCKQQHSEHPFVVIYPNGEKSVELFPIPTACVCHIQDDSFFK